LKLRLINKPDLTEKIIFLDRDGVLNEDSPNYILSPAQWLPIREAMIAVSALKKKGFKIFIISNQSAIGRELLTLQQLKKIETKMLLEVEKYGGAVDDIFYCFHKPDEGCNCRKPKSGLIQQAMRKWNISNIKNIPLVGDKKSDMDLALSVDAYPVYISNDLYSLPEEKPYSEILTFKNLYELILHWGIS
jgi:D-glycero-D-manno-heptose 1,7-bisphosphate phosphatase